MPDFPVRIQVAVVWPARKGRDVGNRSGAQCDQWGVKPLKAGLKEHRSLLVAAVALGLFALLAFVIKSGYVPAFDYYAMSRLPRIDRVRGEPIALFVSHFGSLPNVVLGAAPLALFLLFKEPRQVRLLLAAFAVSPLCGFFKEVVGRNRPEVRLLGFTPAAINSMSFPSGHVSLAVGFYGVIVLLLWRLSSSRRVKITGTVLLAALILSVAVSRVYLGAHYPTDVLGAFLLGIGWLALVAWLEGLAPGKKPIPAPPPYID